MNREELKTYLQERFAGMEITDIVDFPVLYVTPANLIEIATRLKNDKETLFDFLFCQTAVDLNTHFEVIYHLTSTLYHHNLVVKVKIEDRENGELPSVISLWKAAELYECEIFDLFGILFKHHPTLRRIFLGDEWIGHPLRKDYKDDVNVVPI
jgi:NADH-quinone oxidoreductase subunit C